jgi:hypothetical protein
MAISRLSRPLMRGRPAVFPRRSTAPTGSLMPALCSSRFCESIS